MQLSLERLYPMGLLFTDVIKYVLLALADNFEVLRDLSRTDKLVVLENLVVVAHRRPVESVSMLPSIEWSEDQITQLTHLTIKSTSECNLEVRNALALTRAKAKHIG